MHILKKPVFIIFMAIMVLAAGAPLYAEEVLNPPTAPIVTITDSDRHDMQEKYLFHLPVGISIRGNTGELDVPQEDNIAPGIGLGFEIMHAYDNGLCPSFRFDAYWALYPMYPDGWRNFSGKFMTDISFDARVILHVRPKNIGRHVDLYFGGGMEASLFNPYSNQHQVQSAFGHDYDIKGVFNTGFGATCIWGMAYDFTGNNDKGYSVFAEGELRNLSLGHVYLAMHAGVRYTL